jgi:hypothetical protein
MYPRKARVCVTMDNAEQEQYDRIFQTEMELDNFAQSFLSNTKSPKINRDGEIIGYTIKPNIMSVFSVVVEY